MNITQGNWIARIKNSGTGIDVIEEKTGFGVVWLGTKGDLKDCEYPLEEAKANALLIAAAPDLLECSVKLMDAVLDKMSNAHEVSKELFDLTQAIKKAQGHIKLRPKS